MIVTNKTGEELKYITEQNGDSWYYDFLENESTNEDLVQIIQTEDDDYAWFILEKKTKNLFHYVFNKYVSEFYKDNAKEDIYSVIKTGWVKAVKTYDPSRTTVGFIPYASFIMRQHYIMYVRRIKEDRIGNSVRDELFSGAQVDTQEDNDKMASGCITNIMKYECDEFKKIELTDFIREKLELLKDECPIQHNFVKLHYIDGVSQKKLGEVYNMSQSAVSRKISKGLAFLKTELLLENAI
ncbi:MAG: sigma-70 family RNA polymerase sigma factor [Paraclostridium sp.]